MRTPPRRIRSKLETGQQVFGATLQLPCPEIVEIAGHAGLDYVWIDSEHGTFDLRDIAEMVRAADASGLDALVRVPDHSASFIQRVLDLGSAGIIVPHVRNAAEASALVAAAKFAPAGTRGACPCTRDVGHVSLDWSTDYRRANADVLVFGLIEDVEGVENVEAIAHESGIDGLLFGPFDLSQSLGFEGDIAHPDIEQMEKRVTSAAQAAGIEYITLAWGVQDLATVCSYSRIFTVMSDRGALFNRFRGALEDKVADIANAGVGTAA
jgi:2-keto-3-deoxy-L-rhamnonate aldolase RhmA